MFEIRVVLNRRDTWCIYSPVQWLSLCLAPLLTRVHLGTLQELLASLGTSECLLEYAQATAVTRVQAPPQHVLSASGQFALPPASSNEGQVGQCGAPVYSPRVVQTGAERKGSHIQLSGLHAAEVQVWLLSTRKRFLGFSNWLSFHMHVPGVIYHLSLWTAVGTSPIATSYWAPHSHQRYTGTLAVCT